ncbi:MAG TPA: MATE family efflux transporter [Chthoniobacterales bacterium]
MRLARFLNEGRTTFLLAIPMMAGQAGQMLIGITDTTMVARVGVYPLAAAAFAQNLIGFCFVTGLGLQIPISILASQARGAGDPRTAGETLRHGLAIGICTGLGIALSLTTLSFFLSHFGQDPEVVREAAPFLRIVAWSLLPTMIEVVMKQFCDAMGRPSLPMTIVFGEVLLNIFLNWVLIFGNLGAPALGLTGAGIATLIARTTAATTLATIVLGSGFFREYLPARWLIPIDWQRIGRMLTLGVPISLSLLMEVAAFGTAALMMGWISAQTLAAHQIAISCAAFTFMFPLGISMATRIRVGHARGAGERERLPWIGFSSLALAAVMMGTFATVFLLFGNELVGLFVKDPDVVALAASLLFVAAVFQIFDGLQVVGGGALNGLGDVRIPTAAAFVAYWIIALPSAYVLAFKMGAGGEGIWWSLAAGLAAASVFAITRFWWLTVREQCKGNALDQGRAISQSSLGG